VNQSYHQDATAHTTALGDRDRLIVQLQTRLRWLESAVAAGTACLVASWIGLFAMSGPARVPTAPAAPPAAMDATFDEVTCSALRLVDAAGSDRVRLGTDPDGSTRIAVLDRAGRKRLTIMADPSDRASLEILAADETPRVVLGALMTDEALVEVNDAEGERRIAVHVTEDNHAVIAQHDPLGGVRLVHAAAADGSCVSKWFDASKNHRLVAFADDERGAFFDTNDANEVIRVRTFAFNDGTSGSLLSDSENRDRMLLLCDDSEFSSIHWWDGLGRLRMMAATAQDSFLPPVQDVMEFQEPDWKDK
jgi:hypothetical protein